MTRLDVFCRDFAVVDAIVDELVLGVGAVASHLNGILDLVITISIVTHCNFEIPGPNMGEIGGDCNQISHPI